MKPQPPPYTSSPSLGDLLYSGKAAGWPEVEAGGVRLGPGEASWREGAAALEAEQRLAFWRARGARVRPLVEDE